MLGTLATNPPAKLPLLVLLLQWTCRAVWALHTYSCEGQTMFLQCPFGNATFQSVLFIHSASFGRQQGSVFRCRENTNLVRPCDMDVTNLFRYRCQGQASCQTYVELALFQAETFCPEFNKYAWVEFECVAPQSLSSSEQCMTKCLPAPMPAPYSSYGSKYGTSATNGYGTPASHTQFHLAGGVYGGNTVMPASAQAGPPAQPPMPMNIPGRPAPAPAYAGALSSAGPSRTEPPAFAAGGPPAQDPGVGGSRQSAIAALMNLRDRARQAAGGKPPMAQTGSPPASLMARIGRMLGAMRSGKMG